MAKTVAIANQKGGVGKTTTAINLAAALGKLQKRTLLVDVDPQANATSGLGVPRNSSNRGIYSVLIESEPIGSVTLDTPFGFSVVPSNRNLAGAEIEMINLPDRELILRGALLDVKDHYDFILLDCPPALNLLTINALVAADSLLMPIQSEYYALEGASELFNTYAIIRRNLNPELAIEGLLITMFDDRTNLSSAVAADLRNFYKDLVLETMIPRNVRLAEAPSYGKPILFYDERSRGAECYMRLAEEVLGNDKTTVGQGSECSSSDRFAANG